MGNAISAQGFLTISSGGKVVTNAITVGYAGTSSGEIDFDGGTLKAYNAANPAWLSAGSGSANVYIQAGGATFDTNGYDMGIGMALQSGAGSGGLTKNGVGKLTLSGANSYTGVTTVNAGILDLVGPNAWNPVFNYGGAYVAGGQLVFDYSGQTSPYATIAGLMTGATPKITGLSSLTLRAVDNLTNLVTVSLWLQGDANGDHTVNSTDLGLLLSHYNATVSGDGWAWGDFDANGTVNSTDLGLLLSHYNQTSPATSAVPEPSTLLLTFAGLVGLLAYAWRKRK